MDKIANYTTTDLYLAATLRALSLSEPDNVGFIGIFGSHARKEFNFYIDSMVLDDLINSYYSRNLHLDAKTLVESIKELKERVSGSR